MGFPNEKRYRLRQGDHVVGYMRAIDAQSFFYSKDSFWWSGRPLEYSDVDEWTGYVDKNRAPIYEWDIIRFKIDPDGDYTEGVVLWEVTQQRFVIRHLKRELHFPFETDGLQLFDQRQLEVFSYLFINPDLIHELGLDDD